jgi:hypothetical protein
MKYQVPEKPYKVYVSGMNPIGSSGLFKREEQGEFKECQEAIDKAQTVLDSIKKGKYVYVEWQTPGNVIVVWLKKKE